MSGYWLLAVLALVVGVVLAAVAAHGFRRDTVALDEAAARMAALGADARSLGGEVEALRQRVATTAAGRGDG
jgi:hypothetical protein